MIKDGELSAYGFDVIYENVIFLSAWMCKGVNSPKGKFSVSSPDRVIKKLRYLESTYEQLILKHGDILFTGIRLYAMLPI